MKIYLGTVISQPLSTSELIYNGLSLIAVELDPRNTSNLNWFYAKCRWCPCSLSDSPTIKAIMNKKGKASLE